MTAGSTIGATGREGSEGVAVRHEPTDVLFAAYLYPDPARLDLQAVLDAGVRIEGAVRVSRDHAGELHIEEKDHLARQDGELPGGVGLAVGLFGSPRLLATAGAAIGGGLGEFADLGLDETIAEQAGEAIPFDGAGLIVAYPRSSADTLDKALTRAVKKTVGETDGKKVDALKRALAEAQEKMTRGAAAAGDTR